MYAKVLWPGSAGEGPVAMLVATAPRGALMVQQLLTVGWKPYLSDIVEDLSAEIQVAPDRFVLVRQDVTLLSDDTNPVSPPGWWKAVDARGEVALCVIVEHGLVDLTASTFAHDLARLIDSPRTASAMVRVSQ